MVVPIEIYGAPDCSLCAEAKRTIEAVKRRSPVAFEVREVDITGDRALESRFRAEIPVVFVGGRKAFKYRVAEEDLLRRLARAAASLHGSPGAANHGGAGAAARRPARG